MIPACLLQDCLLLALGIADILGVPVAEKRRTSNTALSAVSIASISRGDYRAVSIEFIDHWIWTNTNSDNGEVISRSARRDCPYYAGIPGQW